jgi:hypothetical protein
VIVPSLPVTPEPAVAGPDTGGQYVAHEPVHFEVVEVSGANQYKVRPLAFVSTTFPLMVLMDSTVPAALDDAGLDGAALDGAGSDVAAATGLPLPVAAVLAELPHAATASATAASPVAPSIFRIRRSPHAANGSYSDHVRSGQIVHRDVRISMAAPAAGRPIRARAGDE